MKKLIMALVVAAVAVASNAATVSWKSGANIMDPSGVTKLGKDAYKMYVWDNLTATEYSALTDSKAIYEAYQGKLSSAIGGGVSSGSASLGTTVKNTDAADSTQYYAAVLLTYKDADGKDWYIANKASAITDATGGGASMTNLGKNWEASGAALSWTQAVPEPTSGLLLLLGMAGLALKRKHA